MAKTKTLHVDAGGRTVRVDLSYELDETNARRVLSVTAGPHDTSERPAVNAAVKEWADQSDDPEPTTVEPLTDPVPARTRRSTAVV